MGRQKKSKTMGPKKVSVGDPVYLRRKADGQVVEGVIKNIHLLARGWWWTSRWTARSSSWTACRSRPRSNRRRHSEDVHPRDLRERSTHRPRPYPTEEKRLEEARKMWNESSGVDQETDTIHRVNVNDGVGLLDDVLPFSNGELEPEERVYEIEFKVVTHGTAEAEAIADAKDLISHKSFEPSYVGPLRDFTTRYACRVVTKRVTIDDFKEGEANTSNYALDTSFEHLVSGTLQGLLAKIMAFFDFEKPKKKGEKVFEVVEEETDRTVLVYTRTENVDSLMPSETQVRRWKEGKYFLYSAEYKFVIEKQLVGTVPTDELKAVGVIA